ncbi:MAG: RNA polymerase sigma factor [Candidatus Binatia bacterium]
MAERPRGPGAGRELYQLLPAFLKEEEVLYLSPIFQWFREQKEAFILGKYQGRGYREIAEILGCSEGAVKVRIHRAVRQLRRALGEFAHPV